MNCQHARKNLTNALAAGESHLSTELASHLSSCNGCRIFYEAEAKLMHSINVHLGTIVNQPTPPSLLPRVREQLEEVAPRNDWVPVLLPVATVLAIAAMFSMNLLQHKNMPAIETIASVHPKASEQVISMQLSTDSSKAMTVSPLPRRQPTDRFSRPQQPFMPTQSGTPEILVSPDELRGLRLLVSNVYREPALGSAILSSVVLPPSISKSIATQEIAPVEVASLEIRPLADEDH